MVWLTPEDFVGAEELLEKHYAGELVRKGHRPEGQPGVRPRDDRRPESERPADDEAKVARRLPTLLDEVSEAEARERIALTVEGTDVSPIWNLLEDSGRLDLNRLPPARG